jgi:hypothetical protein
LRNKVAFRVLSTGASCTVLLIVFVLIKKWVAIPIPQDLKIRTSPYFGLTLGRKIWGNIGKDLKKGDEIIVNIIKMCDGSESRSQLVWKDWNLFLAKVETLKMNIS